MNRYAPELALITGGLLGIVFGGFVLVSVGEFYSAALICVLLGYPFAAYAIHTDDEPTTVLPPRAVIAVAGLAAVGVIADVLRLFAPSLESLLVGILVALVVFLPVAAYAAGYGTPPAWLGSRLVEAGGTLLAAGLLAAGLVSGAAVPASTSAVAVFVATMLFAARSTGVSPRRRRLVPVGGLVVAAGILAVGVLGDGPLDPWVTTALGAVFAPLLYIALATSGRA
ncbi:hypothetical protein [Halohasta litorea]|uniref:Uncharacterized protein n=1 Tax=Halohasta litorea TaxID=869891 RepID=A0ABD6DBM6_9EURY|nr:hypothetical protein [Halohasta litorea]